MKANFLILVLICLCASCDSGSSNTETTGTSENLVDTAINPLNTNPLSSYPSSTYNSDSARRELTEDAIQEILEEIADELKDKALDEASEKYEDLKERMASQEQSSDEHSRERAENLRRKHQPEFAKIENQLEQLDVAATSHVKRMGRNNRWERMRKSFLNTAQKMFSDGGDAHWTADQYKLFIDELNAWEDYKEQNKISWYRANDLDLEEKFFEYSKNNAEAKAVWGFILQQKDWDAAANFYRGQSVTGKPYYFLKYYYETTGKHGQIDDLYNDAVNSATGPLCN